MRRVYTHLEREAALLADGPQLALAETAVAVQQDVAQRHALVALVQRRQQVHDHRHPHDRRAVTSQAVCVCSDVTRRARSVPLAAVYPVFELYALSQSLSM